MKTSSTLVLLYGHDEHLLETRQWVLQTRGYRVMTMVRRAGIASLAPTPPARLLLLCHSLTAEERKAASDLARSRWPEIQCVVLTAESARTPSGLLGQLLHTMDGPATLIGMVEKLLGPRTSVEGSAA